MKKFKTILKKIFRIEDKENPTSHQINDREIMQALYLSNKEEIDEFAAINAKDKAAKDKVKREQEAERAEARRKVEELQAEREEKAKVERKRRIAEEKFALQRERNIAKNKRKKMKMHRKGQGW